MRLEAFDPQRATPPAKRARTRAPEADVEIYHNPGHAAAARVLGRWFGTAEADAAEYARLERGAWELACAAAQEALDASVARGWRRAPELVALSAAELRAAVPGAERLEAASAARLHAHYAQHVAYARWAVRCASEHARALSAELEGARDELASLRARLGSACEPGREGAEAARWREDEALRAQLLRTGRLLVKVCGEGGGAAPVAQGGLNGEANGGGRCHGAWGAARADEARHAANGAGPLPSRKRAPAGGPPGAAGSHAQPQPANGAAGRPLPSRRPFLAAAGLGGLSAAVGLSGLFRHALPEPEAAAQAAAEPSAPASAPTPAQAGAPAGSAAAAAAEAAPCAQPPPPPPCCSLLDCSGELPALLQPPSLGLSLGPPAPHQPQAHWGQQAPAQPLQPQPRSAWQPQPVWGHGQPWPHAAGASGKPVGPLRLPLLRTASSPGLFHLTARPHSAQLGGQHASASPERAGQPAHTALAYRNARSAHASEPLDDESEEEQD